MKFRFIHSYLSILILPIFPIHGQDPSASTALDKKQALGHSLEDAKEISSLKPSNRVFARIDAHALSTPESAESNITSLAAYLNETSTTDLEKARAIFVWLTKNINYDDESFNAGTRGDNSAEGVLKNRKAVCEGFSNLYYVLGKEMSLDIQKVSGYSKGYSYRVGQKFTKTNHAWNVIKIDGQWRIFDATWGEGSGERINSKLVSRKEFKEYWFNTNPYEAIFSHMPKDKSFLNVTPEIDLAAFEKFPNIDKGYFQLGFNGESTYKTVLENRALIFPMSYSIKAPIKAISMPPYGHLSHKDKYDFEFFIPTATSVAITDARNTWTYFVGDKGTFKLRYKAVLKGKFSVHVKYPESGDNSYHTILTYSVQ